MKPCSGGDVHRAETMRPFARGKETQRLHTADMGVTLGDTARTEPDRQEHCLHRSIGRTTRDRSWKGKGELQLRIVSYNPFTFSSEGRFDDICHHFEERSEVIILKGTTAKTGLMKEDP